MESFFGNVELGLELWTVISGISGISDYSSFLSDMLPVCSRSDSAASCLLVAFDHIRNKCAGLNGREAR